MAYFEASILVDPNGEPLENVALLATSGIYSGDIELWASGSDTIGIDWGDGSINPHSLTSELQLISNTYSGTAVNIVIHNQSNLQEVLIVGDSEIIITTDDLNLFTSLDAFSNIGCTALGFVNVLDNNITHLNLGSNALVTGSLNSLFSSMSISKLNIANSLLTISDSSVSIDSQSKIYLSGNQFTDTEVDNIINNSVANAFDLTIAGDNGNRTSASDTAYNQHVTNGAVILLNGIEITSASYSNTGQTFTEGTTGTDMVLTTVPDPGSEFTIEELIDALPPSWTVNSTTGLIEPISDAGTAGDYNIVVRVRAYGEYTGFVDVALTPTIDVALSSVGHYIAFGDTISVTSPNSGRYWNELLLADVNGTLSNIVDEYNSATTIDIVMSGWNGANDNQGYNVVSEGIQAAAWRHNHLMNTNGATVTIQGLDNAKTYNIDVGGSRNTSAGTRIAEITIGSMQTLDAEANPAEIVSWATVSPTSNEIVITFDKQSGSNSFPLSFITVTEN